MSVNAVDSVAAVGTAYGEKTKSDSKATEKKETAAPKQDAAVYEKSKEVKPATYSINKMSQEDRKKLVEQLKADQESRQQSLLNIVQQMLGGQAKAQAIATDDDSIWKFLASGKFTVDAATKAQAQADIAEDGYWGVKQTAQRMFDFASALAGDDVDKMKEMYNAMQKGFKKAEKTWGRELPDISKQTMEAANKLFDDYFAANAKSVEE